MNLLLIEDDRDAAGYLVKALTEAGYRVDHAADGRDGLFQATVEATEEAIVNAMVAAEDLRGDRGHLVKAIPHAELRAVLQQYGRLQPAAAD
jgi:DNA-binding response OmpR family regulator